MNKKRRLMFAVNIASLLVLGLIMQIGGAYLVNAAVEYFGKGAGAGTPGFFQEAAKKYLAYMAAVREYTPAQIVQAMFVFPLVEELVFRLIFLRAGKMIMPFWVANLTQAVLFAVYHSLTLQRIYAFVLGLMIGCVFYYCPIIYRSKYTQEEAGNKKDAGLLDMPDSLIGVMLTFILHVAINSAGLFITPLIPADVPLSFQIFAGTTLLVIATLACLRLFLCAQTKHR